MHLKSLMLKGFKSFHDRTRLDFGPGVSVVVGPNGSGKSNVTDAVLWAMGEQSPLAVRGQSMQDVIFGGGRGVQARSSAEVEIVLDNSDGTVGLPVSEISILRRLDRSGEGEYRLNGARCRLVDVIEVLSDTGLGKETHSVISQGRVEAIVTSKPRDRRLLIEEAAGLGKHRKRRRRAQLKLERTQENLDRALDVEREARSRLRPLKRQAEAAELHERLERQLLEARLRLARETLRVRRGELEGAEAAAQAARGAREAVEGELAAVVERRGHAERALAERSERHDELAGRTFRARAAHERLQMRREHALAAAESLEDRAARVQREIDGLRELLAVGEEDGSQGAGARIAELEDRLAELDRERERELERELVELTAAHERAGIEVAEHEHAVRAAGEVREQADARAETARTALREAEREVDATRRDAARVGAELAAVNQFLRSHGRSFAASGVSATEGGEGAPRALSELLKVQAGYELALAAVLGARLDAALVDGIADASALLDGAGPDGASALLAGGAACAIEESSREAPEGEGAGGAVAAEEPAAPAREEAESPAPGAQRLIELVRAPGALRELAERLLGDTWAVERLEDLPADFAGTAVTQAGRVWFAATGEVRQVTAGGAERVLARRNEREQLIAATDAAVTVEHTARAGAERALEEARATDVVREQADGALREAQRAHSRALEQHRQAGWLVEQRRAAPEQGALAVRRAELHGELAAERRQAERLARERSERSERLAQLLAQQDADALLRPLAARLAQALESAGAAVAERVAELDAELARHSAAGEEMAGELRACAAAEAELQARLRAEGEAVTVAEVAAQRLRDQVADATQELRTVAERLEISEDEQMPAEDEPLAEEEQQALAARVERLQRRREQLGPVNPLAQEEYAQALAHVEELEGRRADLETALRELRTVIRDTDRQIHETFQATFEAAARNFEELARDVFPGGSGRLRLVKDEQVPRQVLGGQPMPSEAEGGTTASEAEVEAAAEAEAEEQQQGAEAEEMLGVEIEITPAGKSAKRLSLLSGGEKSMTALAFLFSVFLARPCPFYIMDEVEAALDDLNLDRFLALLRRYADRAQFIVITHQKRTMEAADWLYGVSMAGNGVSKVLSRKLPPAAALEEAAPARVDAAPGAEAEIRDMAEVA
jgi:chromosome segregation protein